MSAARILAVGDGLCRNKSVLEGVRGADIRLRRSGTHRDACPREHDLGATGEFSALDEIPDHIFIRNNEVDAGAIPELAVDLGHALELDRNLIATLFPLAPRKLE